MTSVLRLSSFLSLFLTLVSLNQVLAAPSNSTASTSSKSTACSTIIDALGSTKVINATSDPNGYYYSRTHYYSSKNAANHPDCVALVETTKDVQTVIKAVTKFGSRFAVKAGGHNTNTGGSSTTGVLIDMRNMKQKSIDAGAHTATYQPGNRWSDIYEFLQDSDQGQQVVGGRLGDVGTGLSLGGGLSYLSAQYGLSCDNFLELEVVLPNGDIVTANGNNEYSDLFTFLKGSGNGAGVVTQYTVKTHDVGQTYYGDLIISADHEEAIHEAVVDFVKNAPSKAAIIVTRETLLTRPIDIYLILCSYDGADPGDSYAQFDKIPHIADTRKVGTYVDSTSLNDVKIYGYDQLYRAGSFNASIESINDVVGTFKKFGAENGLQYDLLSLAIQPVPASLVEQSRAAGGNSFDSPDGPYFFTNALVTTNPGALNYASLIKRFETDIYPPLDPSLPIFLNDAQFDQPIIQSYGAYEKVKATKKKYDPANFFSTHQTGPNYA